ncbi:MAG: CmcJ/NvfI family oxidoreductase, partial [Pseudomonadota bacterium]
MATTMIDGHGAAGLDRPGIARAALSALSGPRGAVTAELKHLRRGGGPARVHVGAPGATVRHEGVEELRPTTILDGRPYAADFTLDRNGFALRRHDSAVADFEDAEERAAVYDPEVAALVRAATGAAKVLVFDHTVRKDAAGAGRQPARHVHVDYTDVSGPARARDFLTEAEAAALADKRLVQINVWRPITRPVERAPLALLDAATLAPEDLAPIEIHNEGRVGEIYGLYGSEGHRWWWFPNMRPDQAVLIKGYDSARDGRARFTPHTAFDVPGAPASAAPRESVETRTF